MASLPEPSRSTAREIHKLWDGRNKPNRTHLGCSVIGHSCDRHIWLSWRWAKSPSFPGRLLRLFDTGKREEERLIKDLSDLGVEIHTSADPSGAQIAVSALDGHLAGSVDGVGRGFIEAPKSWAVLECKTHNAKSFAKLQKEGVKNAKPQHYVQMQMYMGLLELERAMYLAQCKDNDDIYSEWVHFEKDCFEYHMKRAKTIIESSAPPAGISDDPGWYECKLCDHYELCHGEQIAEMNCRTCCHASPTENGSWTCGNGKGQRSIEEQRKGCDAHLFIPPLIPYALPVDGGENWVEYEKKDASRFINGIAPGQWLSSELVVTMPSLVGDKGLQALKDGFPEARVESSHDIWDGFKDDLDPVYNAPAAPLTDEQKKIKKAVAALERQRNTKYKE